MSDKMREEFEAWASTSAYLGLGDKADLMFDNFDENGYDHPEVHLAWLGWQASRADIEVEWPGHYDYTNSDVAGAAILDCRTAFQKAIR